MLSRLPGLASRQTLVQVFHPRPEGLKLRSTDGIAEFRERFRFLFLPVLPADGCEALKHDREDDGDDGCYRDARGRDERQEAQRRQGSLSSRSRGRRDELAPGSGWTMDRSFRGYHAALLLSERLPDTGPGRTRPERLPKQSAPLELGTVRRPRQEPDEHAEQQPELRPRDQKDESLVHW